MDMKLTKILRKRPHRRGATLTLLRETIDHLDPGMRMEKRYNIFSKRKRSNILQPMSKLTVNIPHSLSKDEAQQRIQQIADQPEGTAGGQDLPDIKETWEGDNASLQFHIKGFDISGGIQVNPGKRGY